MKPFYHILTGALFAFLFFLIFKISLIYAVILFFSSFLFDFDHYLYYLFTKKDLSLKRASNWFLEYEKKARKLSLKEKNKYKSPVVIFHGIEFWIPLFFLSLYFQFFFFIFLGFSLHLILDFMDLSNQNCPLLSKISQIYVYVTNKNKKSFKNI